MENLPITLVEAFACARLVMAAPMRWQQMSAVARRRDEEKLSSEALAPRWFSAILDECAARPDGAAVAEVA